MEEPFLRRDKELLLPCKATWQTNQFTIELKKVSRLAAPMAIVTIAQYLLPVISVMVAGHKGELQLAGVALATSFTNVSGFSIMVIMLCLSLLQFKNPIIDSQILKTFYLFQELNQLSNIEVTSFIFAVWVSGRTRNSLWPSLWSQTI